MNRRSVLKAGMATAGFAMLLPKLSFAQQAPNDPASSEMEEMILTAEISANHGHALNLSPVQALKLLRATKNSGPVSLDIKGQSGHPHAVAITHEDLLLLFEQGTLAKDSSLVAGHSHHVTIHLDVTEV